jgi:hypothetical protein
MLARRTGNVSEFRIVNEIDLHAFGITLHKVAVRFHGGTPRTAARSARSSVPTFHFRRIFPDAWVQNP